MNLRQHDYAFVIIMLGMMWIIGNSDWHLALPVNIGMTLLTIGYLLLADAQNREDDGEL